MPGKTFEGKGTGGGAPLRLLIDISRTYYQMEKYDEAKAYYEKALLVDAEKAQGIRLPGGDGRRAGARAAEERDPGKDILFVEE